LKKILFQLYLDPEQVEFVKEKSRALGWSRAGVVRHLIERQMKREEIQREIEEAKTKEAERQ